MPVTHWVKARSGDSYTGQDGQEKEAFVTIGRLLENARGGKMIILDCMPFSWFAAGKPVVLFLNAKDEVRTPAPSRPAPATTQPGLDDDIPFILNEITHGFGHGPVSRKPRYGRQR